MLAFGDPDPPPELSKFEIILNKLVELFSSVAHEQTQSIQDFLLDPKSALHKAIDRLQKLGGVRGEDSTLESCMISKFSILLF